MKYVAIAFACLLAAGCASTSTMTVWATLEAGNDVCFQAEMIEPERYGQTKYNVERLRSVSLYDRDDYDSLLQAERASTKPTDAYCNQILAASAYLDSHVVAVNAQLEKGIEGLDTTVCHTAGTGQNRQVICQ